MNNSPQMEARIAMATRLSKYFGAGRRLAGRGTCRGACRGDCRGACCGLPCRGLLYRAVPWLAVPCRAVAYLGLPWLAVTCRGAGHLLVQEFQATVSEAATAMMVIIIAAHLDV
jgi:hypothetical protein